MAINTTQTLQTQLKNFYALHHLEITDFIADQESKEYNACSFQLNEKKIIFRTAKITPTKIGLFVTIWKRIENGPIMPFDSTNDIAYIIIQNTCNEQTGQFILPKSVLIKQDHMSRNGVSKKRAMRVYPPWKKPKSAQALKTQA